jgi:hypothetical protein
MLSVLLMEQKQNTAAGALAVDMILEGLNPAQRRAVAYGIGAEKGTTSPLLIAAGAGTARPRRWRTGWRD